MIQVSIIGGAGYGAAELLRHLLVRDDVKIHRISSKDYVGQSCLLYTSPSPRDA